MFCIQLLWRSPVAGIGRSAPFAVLLRSCLHASLQSVPVVLQIDRCIIFDYVLNVRFVPSLWCPITYFVDNFLLFYRNNIFRIEGERVSPGCCEKTALYWRLCFNFLELNIVFLCFCILQCIGDKCFTESLILRYMSVLFYWQYRPSQDRPVFFRESLTTPTATFPEIFNGPLFRSILWMRVQNLKFVALPVPEIIGGIPKNWTVPGYAHAPFCPKCFMGFCSDRPYECTGQFWSP